MSTALLASAAPALADTPQLGDTSTLEYFVGDPSTGWQHRAINDLPVYCLDYPRGEQVGSTFTMTSGGEADTDPKVIWLLVHGGATPPAAFAIESGITGLSQRELYEATQVAIWYSLDQLTTTGPHAQDPVTILNAVTSSAPVPQREIDAEAWLAANAVAFEPTSETGTLEIAKAAGYHAEPDGLTGPFVATASSGVTSVLLSASTGEVVDADGQPIAGVVPQQPFYVKNAGGSSVIDATATNIFVPGWTWMPSSTAWQRLSYASSSTLNASFPMAPVTSPSATPTPKPTAPTPTPTPTTPIPQSPTAPPSSTPAPTTPADAGTPPAAAPPGDIVNTGGELVSSQRSGNTVWAIALGGGLLAVGAGLVVALRRRHTT